MSKSEVVKKYLLVPIGGAMREFYVINRGTVSQVYEIVTSERKVSAQLQAADPAIVPTVLRVFGRR